MQRTFTTIGLLLALFFSATAVAQDEGAFETIDEATTEILAREPVTERAEVKHILIAWVDLAAVYGGRMDPRAQARTHEQANELALQLLAQIRAGDPIDALMAEHSEDPGSATTGRSYTATPDAGLVPPFKALGLRLNVGEAGLVLTRFGWHVIQRTE